MTKIQKIFYWVRLVAKDFKKWGGVLRNKDRINRTNSQTKYSQITKLKQAK